jgi:hypothetical protein
MALIITGGPIGDNPNDVVRQTPEIGNNLPPRDGPQGNMEKLTETTVIPHEILGRSNKLTTAQLNSMQTWRKDIRRLTGANAGKIFLNGLDKTGQVALTFDDGPDGNFTPQVLDILQKYQAKEAFT